MSVTRTPQVGVQGDTNEGIDGDTQIVRSGAGSSVEGVRESQGIGHVSIMTSF